PVDTRKLMLTRSNSVMLCLGINTKSIQLLVNISHLCRNSGLDCSKVVILHLLTLGSRCAVKGSSGVNEVLSLCIHFSVNQEILLLGTYVCHNSCSVGTEQLKNSQRRLINSLH